MSAAAEAAVIAAMLGGARTSAEIRTVSSLSAAEVKAGIQRARFKGKILFDRLALAPSQRAEAEAVDAVQAERIAQAERMMDSDPAAAASAPHGQAGDAADEAVREEDGGADVRTAPPSDLASPITGVALAAEVDAWLEKTGMQAARFALGCGNNKAYLHGLRRVASPTSATVAKVRAFLAAHPQGIRRPARPGGHSETQKAKHTVEAPPPPQPVAVADQVKQDAVQAGARRRVAQSTGSVCTPLPVAEPEVRRGGDPVRRAFDVPMHPPAAGQARRRIALPSDLSPVETIQTMLAGEPRDLIRAIVRTHEALWCRCVLLARARGETPAAVMYAALARGLDALEAESSKEKAHA